MKKNILATLALTVVIVVMAATAWAQTQKLTVTFIGNNPWGGSYVAMQTQMDPLTRDEVKQILGPPTREYGYSDVWLAHDQIYIGYYNLMGQPVSVVILPVTSW